MRTPSSGTLWRVTDPAPLPAPTGRRLTRRLVQLYAGLVVFGVSMAMVIRSGLGNIPWDVLHQGLTRVTGLTFGVVAVATSLLVLLLWIPLREKPGIGTISNALVIGPVADVVLRVIPEDLPLAARIGMLVGGIVLNGAATAAYIGARFGPGPRDGLMTGFAERTGRSIRFVRTLIEVVVVALGWALGGVFGVGTVLFAFTIGPLIQLFLPRFDVPRVTPYHRPEA